jgi:DNA-binding transcriptional ArsR family regulator
MAVTALEGAMPVEARAGVVLSDDLLGLVAQRMGLLSDPSRLRLLLVLQDGREASVQDLADVLDTEHRNASRNLNALCADGLLARRRAGTRVLYSLADYATCKAIGQIAQSVAAHVEELSERVLKGA